MSSLTHNPPFFILGRERSGTTLLRSILNAHNEVFIPLESPFIMHLYAKYHSNKNINIDVFLADLYTEPYFPLWNINREELRNRLISLKKKGFNSLCTEILKFNAPRNIRLLGDKNPTNILFGHQLAFQFADSKFIWIMRDYRAQVNSMLKVNFEKKIVSSLAIRWKIYNQHIKKLQDKFPKKVLLVVYENLVTNPENEVKKICHFLNIVYDSQMIRGIRSQNETVNFNAHHKSLNKTINTSHIDEWKTALTTHQIKVCETICDSFAKQYGYETTHTTFNFFKKIFLLPGLIYGRLYIPFIKLLYWLPLSLKKVITRKIIHPNSKFWTVSKAQMHQE